MDYRYRRIVMKNIFKKVLLPMLLAIVLVVPSFSVFAATNITPVTFEVTDFDKREVISYSYSLNQATDDNNQISGLPKMATVKVRVKATSDGNDQLQQWMLDPHDKREAKIVVQNTVDGSTSKTFVMSGATCVKHNLVYGDAEYGDYEDIEIACQTFQNGPIEYVNNNLTGTTVSNGNNNVVIIACSAAAIVAVATIAVVVVKKKNKK